MMCVCILRQEGFFFFRLVFLLFLILLTLYVDFILCVQCVDDDVARLHVQTVFRMSAQLCEL